MKTSAKGEAKGTEIMKSRVSRNNDNQLNVTVQCVKVRKKKGLELEKEYMVGQNLAIQMRNRKK